MNGATSFIHAAYYTITDVVEVLEKYYADTSIKDIIGNFTLYYAYRIK